CTEVEDLGFVRVQVRVQVEPPVLPVEDGRMEVQLPPRVLDRADVLELCEGEALRRRLAHVEECVRRPLTIPRQLRAQPVVEHRPVEADLHFGCAFRPEVRVAQVRGRVRRLTAVPYGVPRADGVEGARCTPRLTPRRTQLE